SLPLVTFLSITHRPPKSTLFPYTTLFRSQSSTRSYGLSLLLITVLFSVVIELVYKLFFHLLLLRSALQITSQVRLSLLPLQLDCLQKWNHVLHFEMLKGICPWQSSLQSEYHLPAL